MKKIIIFSTRIRESSVAYQLHLKLMGSGLDSQIVCMESEFENESIKSIKKLHPFVFFIFRLYGYVEYTLEKYFLCPNMKIKHSFDFSVVPLSIIRKLIGQDDVLHFHWCKSGFISTKQIVTLSKDHSLFWTHHDSWLISGLAHHSSHIVGVKEKMLMKAANAISFWLRRKEIEGANIIHIHPSNWQLLEFQKKFKKKIIQKKIHNCFSSELFKTKNKKTSSNYTLGFGAIKADSNPLKGGKELWDILSKLKENTDIAKVNVIVFGVSDIDEIKNNLVGKAGFYEKNITIYGYIKNKEEMANIYSEIDCFIQPSKIESLSIVMLEAMYSGCQVVHFDITGMQDLKEFNPSIISVPPYSSEQFLGSIVECIENKIEGRALSDKDRDEYSDLSAIQKHIELYSTGGVG